MNKLLAELAARLPARPPERRAAGDPIFAPQMVSGLATGGYLVNARLAENLTTLLACVNAISSSIAGLPLCVYRRTADGRMEDETHPLNRLVVEGPNQWQTFPDFVEFLTASTLLRGNGLAEIQIDQAGALTGLVPIPWDWVSPQMLPSGRLAYDVTEITSIFGGTGQSRRLLQDQVLHLRDRTDDGLIGRSRLQRAASAVGTALQTQDFANQMWANGAHPSGAVKVDKLLTKEQKGQLRDGVKAMYQGTRNAAAVLILDQGMSWESISVSPEDQELLASRRFSVEEMCRIYGVPPVIVGDLSNSSFTNAETLLRYFAQFVLRHWTRKLEAEIVRQVFTDVERASMAVEFDMSDFLRGDPKTRWETNKIAVEARILTINEIREAEGYNPIEGGDVLPPLRPAAAVAQ